jgi:hypothetical protein
VTLALLTNAHISLSVAEQIKAKCPECPIYSLRHWRNGELLNAGDDAILTAALAEGLTVVTYDQRTIMPLVTKWMREGREHAGVLLIDDRTIVQEDVGGQVLALLELWNATHDENWANIVAYVKPFRKP